MDAHYILCGLGKVGLRVLEHLRAAGARVVVVDSHEHKDDPKLAGVPIIVGDCRAQETLERAGLEKARGVLILTSDDLVNLSAALIVRHLHPSVRVVVRLFNPNLIKRLGSAVENVYAMSTSALAGPLMALIARTGEALGTFSLRGGRQAQVAEFTVAAGSPLVGQDLAAVAAGAAAVVVAYRPVGGPLRLLQETPAAARLAAGDRLVVCGEPKRLAALLAQGENESLPELLWAGFVRRSSRVVLRTLAQIDASVKVCTAIFVGVLVLSVLVFHLGMERNTLVDSFYRTVSLMTTGADLRGEDFEPGAWQKAFIGSIRLVGIVLTAAFTAIFTNYLIRANLGGALAVRRIPDGGHVIVCGLGNIGFRIVEELHQQGEQVVVIERKPENAFTPTVRRLGVPVIVGDATVAEVLRQARAPTARSVVAASSNDLVNLEIALIARDLAPKQRVVLRLTDPNLAQTLRQAANVRLALSVPELSAPAFVARLFGDRARGLFFIEGRLIMVYDMLVSAGSALAGRPLAVLAAESRFVPVALQTGDAPPRPITAETTLAAGDTLTVVVTQTDLQRLLQREAISETGIERAGGFGVAKKE
jgi:Trk K+ transport system NAD-binding subunit